MNISCKSIDDFCNMISTCVVNGIKDVRIFISSDKSYPSVATINSEKCNIKFIYVLFTPLYTAIYNGNVKSNLYDEIYKQLIECQEQSNVAFRIQVFDELSYNPESNRLTINHQSAVI